MGRSRRALVGVALVVGLAVPVAAHALLPLLFGLALLGGATVEVATSTTVAALAVGSVIAFVNVTNPDSSGTAPMHVQLAPDAALPVPAGWTGGAAAGDSTAPATAAPEVTTFYLVNGGGTHHPSYVVACNAYYTSSGLPGTWTNDGYDAGRNCCAYHGPGDPVGRFCDAVVAPATSSACPSGYTVSGATCAKSSEAAVKKPADAKCGVKRSGNTFAVDARDPDCDSLPSGLAVGTNTVDYMADDGSHVHIELDSGTGAATLNTDHANGSGGVDHSTTHLGPPGTGGAAVTGQSQSATAGVGDLATTDPQQLVNVITCGTPGRPPCKIDETGTTGGAGTFTASNVAVDALSTGAVAWDGSTSGTAPWSGLPSFPVSGTCTGSEIHWTWAGHDVVIDWCQYWAPLRDLLGWLLWAMFAVYAWRRLSGALGAGA